MTTGRVGARGLRFVSAFESVNDTGALVERYVRELDNTPETSLCIVESGLRRLFRYSRPLDALELGIRALELVRRVMFEELARKEPKP